MNSRERILTVLNHRDPDQVPFALDCTNVPGIQAKAYRRQRQYLKLPKKRPETSVSIFEFFIRTAY